MHHCPPPPAGLTARAPLCAPVCRQALHRAGAALALGTGGTLRHLLHMPTSRSQALFHFQHKPFTYTVCYTWEEGGQDTSAGMTAATLCVFSPPHWHTSVLGLFSITRDNSLPSGGRTPCPSIPSLSLLSTIPPLIKRTSTATHLALTFSCLNGCGRCLHLPPELLLTWAGKRHHRTPWLQEGREGHRLALFHHPTTFRTPVQAERLPFSSYRCPLSHMPACLVCDCPYRHGRPSHSLLGPHSWTLLRTHTHMAVSCPFLLHACFRA